MSICRQNYLGSGRLSPDQVSDTWPEGHPARDTLLFQWLLVREGRKTKKLDQRNIRKALERYREKVPLRVLSGQA